MSVPIEYAWIVPIAIPLVIGLLVGAIVRKTVKLVITISALGIILVATGYISLTFQDLFDQAMLVLPRLFDSGVGFLDAMPYASTTFLIGLGIGLWKG
ncbi:hypothetical protein ACFL96_13520 [Thermoproteota archaeon]